MHIRERAYAKLNLTLSVYDIATNNLHALESVMQTISLCDELYFEPAKKLYLEGEGESVLKAAQLLRSYTGTREGASVVLKKRIPVSAGLGGGSSDAAATLRGLCKLWKVKLSQKEYLDLSRKLGSDAPFLVRGGRAKVTSFGEILEPIENKKNEHYVVFTPKVIVPNNKTKYMFAYLDKHREQNLIPLDTPKKLVNDFEMVAGKVYEGFTEIVQEVKNLTSTKWQMSGAGPSIFSTFGSKDEAKKAYKVLLESSLGKAFIASKTERIQIENG